MKNIIAASIMLLLFNGCQQGSSPPAESPAPSQNPTATNLPPTPTETLAHTMTKTPIHTPTPGSLTYEEWCAQLEHVNLAERTLVISPTWDGDVDDEELYLVRGDGSFISQLTDNEVIDYQPRWSADGTKLVYLSVDDGNNMVVKLLFFDGDDVVDRKTVAIPEVDYLLSPVWSPDGNQISIGAWAADSSRHIVLLQSNGSGYEIIINLEFLEYGPNPTSWSYDGQYLAINPLISTRFIVREIYI